MSDYVAMPCFYEKGTPGNWRSCGLRAHWSIKTETGSHITYCTKHKNVVSAKMGTPRILEHFKPAPFAEFRQTSD